MSVANSFKKVEFKFKSDSNYHDLLEYFRDVNENLGGTGGIVYAEEVATSDESNVQIKIDAFEADIATNASAISALTSDVSDLTLDVDSLDTRLAALEGYLTPVLFVSDTTSSVTISTTADTTYFQFLNLNFQQNGTAFFDFVGDSLTILSAGVYEITVIANAEKAGTGGTFTEGNLIVSLEINGAIPKNASLKMQVNAAGTIASNFSGKVNFEAGDIVRINFLATGTGVITASSNASHDAFLMQISKL